MADFETVKKALQGHMVEYLESKGIKPSRNKIKCINPEHQDNNPSMSFYPDSNVLHCHGCNFHADLFTAASILDNKPKDGPEWFKQNFLWLAERYGYEVETNLSEEEIYKQRIYKALMDIANIISISPVSELVEKEIKTRNWTKDFCRQHHIGSIISEEVFKKTVLSLYQESFLKEIDILEKNGNLRPMFNTNNLIFTVKDEFGRPIGFAARDLTWYDGKATPKYFNSRATGTKTNVYEKDKTLYGLNHYLKTRKDEFEPLYILEGYPDWATCVTNGLHNVAAIGGTAFCDNHIRELGRLHIHKLIITLDGDPMGQQVTKKLLDEKLANITGLDVSIITIPDQLDPDDFIRAKGIEAFLNLQQHSAFHWRMMNFDDRTDPIEICHQMIPFIAKEQSFLKQEQLIKDLSKFAGISTRTINKELDRIVSIQDKDISDRCLAIVNNLIKQLMKDPESAEIILSTGLHDIRGAMVEIPENVYSAEIYATHVESQKFDEEQLIKASGFNLGSLKIFQNMMRGDWQKDVLLVFSGRSNAGKCQSENSPVLLWDGTYKKIKDVVRDKDINILTMNSFHKFEKGKTINWIDSGILPCYKVKTRDGLETEPSETHPYYTTYGWKQVKDLKVGDKIAIARQYDFSHLRSKENPKFIELLGALLSDGGLTCDVNFTNFDSELMNYVTNLVQELYPNSTYRNETHGTGYTRHFTDKDQKKNRLKRKLSSLNLIGKNSHTKFIPQCVFQNNLKTISKFLGIFYACDGWISEKEDGFEIGISLTNKEMIQQLRHLLLRFGIRTRIKESHAICTNSIHPISIPKFTLVIHNKMDAIKFYNHIHIPLKAKQDKLFSILNKDSKIKGQYKQFPIELWNYIKEKCKEKNISQAQLFKLIFPLNHSFYYEREWDLFKYKYSFASNNLSESLLRTISYILNDDFLRSLADGDIYFDEIISIDFIGPKQCYDLTVENTHNFIVNDTIVHNTAWLSQMALEIAINNDDALVLFLSIDDTGSQLTNRLVTQLAVQEAAGNPIHITMNKIRNPYYYINNINFNHENKDLLEIREKAYNKLTHLIYNNKLIVKDQTAGDTLNFAENLILYYRNKFPDKKIVFVLDNFHKLQDYRNEKEERIRFKKMSNFLKNTIAAKYHICVLSTMEYTKIPPKQKPSNFNLAECLTDDTLIYNMQNGFHKPIKDIVQGDIVGTLDGNFKISPNKVLALIDKGDQEIYEVTLSSGKQIKTTLNHPFFTDTGWKKLSELKVNSFLATPRFLPRLETIKPTINKNKALFLGLMAGDVDKFHKLIPIISRKKQKFEISNFRNNFSDRMPDNFSNLLKTKIIQKFKNVRCPNGFYVQDSRTTRITAKKIINEYFYNDLELQKWINSDIYWEQITSIKPLGNQHCYDLIIENTHNFIANNIFAHNSSSLEYDANGIFHVYNELSDYQQCGEANRCPTWWPREQLDGTIEQAPIFELIFGKNKITDFKGTLYFKFYPEQSRSEFIRPEIVAEWRENIKLQLQNQVKSDKTYNSTGYIYGENSITYNPNSNYVEQN